MGNTESRDVPNWLKGKWGEYKDPDMNFPIPDSSLIKMTREQMKYVVKALYQLPVESVFSAEQIGLMVSSLEYYPVDINKAKRVLKRGEELTPGVFFILAGSAKVYEFRDESDEEIQCLYPGDFFGEFTTLYGSRSSVSVDMQPGSYFAVLVGASIPRDRLKFSLKDQNVQIRVWGANRCYIDRTKETYLQHEVPDQIRDGVPDLPAFFALARAPFFKELPFRALLRLSRQLKMYVLEEGDLLFKADTPAMLLPVILTGSVELVSKTEETLGTFTGTCNKPGICVGEMEFWLRWPHLTTCKATTLCQVVFPDRDDILMVASQMEPDEQEEMKEFLRLGYKRWLTLPVPRRLRDQCGIHFDQDILEHKLLAIPTFRTLEKADFYDLILSMTSCTYCKGDIIMNHASEKGVVLCTGVAVLKKSADPAAGGSAGPRFKAGEMFWSKTFVDGESLLAAAESAPATDTDDGAATVVTMEFDSGLLMQLLELAMTGREEDRTKTFMEKIFAKAAVANRKADAAKARRDARHGAAAAASPQARPQPPVHVQTPQAQASAPSGQAPPPTGSAASASRRVDSVTSPLHVQTPQAQASALSGQAPPAGSAASASRRVDSVTSPKRS